MGVSLMSNFLNFKYFIDHGFSMQPLQRYTQNYIHKYDNCKKFVFFSTEQM
jgi:hypothetical protein